MPRSNTFTRELIELAILIIVAVLMAIVLPSFAGLKLGGFEDIANQEKLIFYYGFLFGGLGIITALRLTEVLRRSRKHPVGNAIIHDPEEDGALFAFSKKSFAWLKNPWRLTAISLIVFSIYGLVGSIQNAFWVGIPQLTFQVTEASMLIFAAEPAAMAETVFFVGLLGIALSLFTYIKYKVRMSKLTYWALTLLILPLAFGALWMAYHTFRYSHSDVALFGTFIFGAAGTLITLLTGSIIPWYIWHFTNNFFVQLNNMFADEKIIVWVAIVIGIFAVVWVVTEVAARFGKRSGTRRRSVFGRPG